MASIPGLAYIIVGLVVGGFSWYTYFLSREIYMWLFFAVGVVFVIVGFVKIFRRPVRKSRQKSREEIEAEREKSIHRAQAEHMIRHVQQRTGQEGMHHPGQQTSHHPGYNEHASQSHPVNYGRHNHPGGHHAPQAYHIVQCPSCGAKNHSTSNFCHICGTKL
ncbi:zinc-ribbon domain-containing protein [Candidatus Woesearchaeota archaeon]|nr:zinc-ribbon domain-containing protein [Candidatus Woesearchaeota archaeon]